MLEFEKRYKKEEQKFMTKTSLVDTNSEEIKGIEKIFNELLQFINNNPDAKILQKASDVTTFLHKSFTDLDIITKNQIAQKSEIYIHPSFKPLTLNVKKAIEIVSKFEMLPPNSMPSNREHDSSRQKMSKRGPPQDYPQTTTSDYENEYGTAAEGYPAASAGENMYTDAEGMSTEDHAYIHPGRSGRANSRNSVRSTIPPKGYAKLPNKSTKQKVASSHREATDIETDGWEGKNRPMNKLRKQGGPYPMQSMIHAYGDHSDFLSYNIEEQMWEVRGYENSSNYSGSLKYMSAVSSPDGKIFLTGGCLISTGDPVNV